jgi:hypothetical protein
LTQLVAVAVAVAADYCTIAVLGDGDAVLVCDGTESSFEVTAVKREGDRLVLLGDRTEPPASTGADRAGTPGRLTVIGSATVRRVGCGQVTSPARSVGPCSTRASRVSWSSTSSCPGRPRASGGSRTADPLSSSCSAAGAGAPEGR